MCYSIRYSDRTITDRKILLGQSCLEPECLTIIGNVVLFIGDIYTDVDLAVFIKGGQCLIGVIGYPDETIPYFDGWSAEIVRSSRDVFQKNSLTRITSDRENRDIRGFIDRRTIDADGAIIVLGGAGVFRAVSSENHARTVVINAG